MPDLGRAILPEEAADPGEASSYSCPFRSCSGDWGESMPIGMPTAEAIQYPDENPKDQRINSYALPILNSEVVAAQSASIDAVSGATVTSNGYTESLQSALDAAHLG